MLLRNVYIGYTNEGKECLLYKTNVYYENLGLCTVFVDLKTGAYYKMDQIDMNSLKSFSMLVNGKKMMRRKKVIKTYDLDREKLIDVKDLFYADIYKKKIVYYRRNSAPVIAPCGVESEVGRNILVERVTELKGKLYSVYYRNLETGEKYEGVISCSGYNMPYVGDVRRLQDPNLEGKIEKRKMLEFNRKGDTTTK